MSPGHIRSGAALGRRGDLRRRRGDDAQGRQRFRRHAPARPSRRDARRRWASASSTTPPSPRATRRRPMAPSASPSSISTSTTATAPSTSSGTIRRVMYASTHEMPLYPGTGALGERGEHDQIVNAPLARRRRRRRVPRGVRGGDPAAASTISRPTCIIISAGFDAHRPRSARQPQPRSRRDFAWVDAQADGDRRTSAAAAASSRCSKAATISRASRARSPPMSAR